MSENISAKARFLDFYFYFYFFSEVDGRGAQDAEAARRRAQQRRWQQQQQTAATPPSDFLFLFLFLGGGLVWNEYTAQCPSPFGVGDIREHETPDLSHRGTCPVGVRTSSSSSLAARPQFQSGFHDQWHAQSPPLFIAVLIPRCIFQTKTNVKRSPRSRSRFHCG